MKPRRVFALPFVAIIGCGGSPKTTSNPPEPTQTEKLAAPPEGTPTKGTGPAGQVTLTYPDGTVVNVTGDATCYAAYKEDCGPSDPSEGPTHCNPPPPQQVRCPAEAK